MNKIKQSGKRRKVAEVDSAARIGFEEQLWRVAEALRGKVEPAEYKHAVLSMLFLHSIIEVGASGIVVPSGATWADLTNPSANRSSLDTLIDELEAANPSFQNSIPRPTSSLHDRELVALARQIGDLPLPTDRKIARDLLGRVYEYFLSKFATAEGRSGGEYYTPKSVVKLLVEMLSPIEGTIYDPCCGTAGMFVQSESFLERHGGDASRLRVVGQESSLTTWRLAKMNLALHGIDGDLGERNADTFGEDLHPQLKADYVIANPPFNQKAWADRVDAQDKRWVFGAPSPSNANNAWIQHIFSHLSARGVAGFVLSNGSLASDQGTDNAIRKRMLERDVVECIVTLPNQLFYGTQIPACLWFISPSKARGGASHLKGRTLMIDARSAGHLVDRTHAELSDQEVSRISSAYHRWRSGDAYDDELGFTYSATSEEIAAHKFALVPGRYVGFSENETRFDPQEVRREIPEAIARLESVSSLAARAAELLKAPHP